MTKADGSILLDTRVDTRGMAKGTSEIKSMFGKTISAAKKVGMAIAAAFAIKKIVSFAKECIDLGSDLEEVQNVVDVTFGKMSGVIDEFAKNAATQFGMSELAAKQYTGTMGAMLKSMGFTTDAAADMSMQMAGLAGDIASFYNLSTDEAFAKIRSGISGETEPLKQLGINMSEANLEQYRMNQGMTTAYSKMSQQEKALLRYNYLLSVTSDAQGDFARTSGSWANQMKVLTLQFQSIKAELGKGLINLFTPVLRVINTLLAGLSKLASAFRAFTELITGKKAESSGGAVPAVELEDTAGAYDDAAAGAQNLADATKETAKATKQAKKENERYLSGLDQIHKFETEKDDTTTATPAASSGKGASGGGSASGGAMPAVDFGSLSKGDTVIDKTAKKMKDLYDLIKKGVQPTIDSLNRLWNQGLAKYRNFAWQGLQDFYNRFLVPVGKWVFGSGIPRFVDALNNGFMKTDWKKINDGLAKLYEQLAPYAINIGEGLLWFWENVLVPFGTWTANEVVPRFLATVTTLVAIANNIIKAAKPAFQWFWENLLQPIANFTGGIFEQVWDGINDALARFAKWCEDNPEKVQAVTKALMGLALAFLFATNPVLALIGVGTLLKTHWETLKQAAKDTWERIKTNITNSVAEAKAKVLNLGGKIKTGLAIAWNSIKMTATNTWNKITSAVSGAVETLRSGVSAKITALKTGISTTWDSVKTKAGNAWTSISTTITTKANSIKDTVAKKITTLRDGLKTTWESIGTKAGTAWDTISTTVIDAAKNIKSKAGSAVKSLKDKFVSSFNGIKDGIKAPINAIIGFINSMIRGVVDGMNSVVDALNNLSFTLPKWVPGLGGKHFGVNIPRIESYPIIPELARGAVIPPNSPFLAKLGDQKHGTNVETPLETIKQAVREAGGNGDIHLTMYLDGRVVYDSVIKHGRQQQQMGGSNPFALA